MLLQKRNFKIKLNEDHRFFNLRNDNNWILDAGQADLFRLRNLIANELWNDFATKPYYHEKEPSATSGIRGKVVELFTNDEYRGIYCFTENMDRKQMKLKKFDSMTGEIRGTLWKSKGYSSSMMYTINGDYDNQSPSWDVFEAKYPDLNDLDSTDYSTLWNSIYFVVNSSDNEFTNQVSGYFDLPVVLDYYLFINVLNALDNRGKNMFWAVYDKTESKMMTPAVWDLDITTGQRMAEVYSPDFSSPTYDTGSSINLIERLITLNVDNFNEKVIERYAELRKSYFSEQSLKNRYLDYYNLLQRSGAAQREQKKWSNSSDIIYKTLDLEEETKYICDWISERLKYLDNKLLTGSQGVCEVVRERDDNNQSVYSLSGQKLTNNQFLKPGIYISKNKKFVIK